MKSVQIRFGPNVPRWLANLSLRSAALLAIVLMVAALTVFVVVTYDPHPPPVTTFSQP